MTAEQLRSIVIECLQRDRPYEPNRAPFDVGHLFYEIAEIAKQRGLKATAATNAWLDNPNIPELYPNLKGPVWAIVWDLIIEGIVRPGDGAPSRQFSLPYIHVTEYGKQALKGRVTPYDPDGYLKNLEEKVPNADPVILRYIAESAATLRANCLLSSTVTLGCASEKAFLLLLAAYTDALNATERTTFEAALKKTRGVKQQHEEFTKSYEQKIKAKLKIEFGTDWLTELDTALTFLFSYFRMNRNAAGHPTDAQFNRELSCAHLLLFPSYLRVICDLIDWIQVNKPL